jgi:hypothetical protein
VRLRDPMGFQIAVHQGLMQHEPLPTRPAFITNAKGAQRNRCPESLSSRAWRRISHPRRLMIVSSAKSPNEVAI